MTPEDFLKVDGFKKKMADKVYTSIRDKIDNSSLPVIMAASNILGRGFGEKRIAPILEQFPDILTTDKSDEEKISLIKSIKGMEKKTAERFVANIPKFMDFVKETKYNKRNKHK